ncbi:DUF6901 family protein [Coraliomargarita sp. W4R53]
MDSEHVIYRFELKDREVAFNVATRPGLVRDGGCPSESEDPESEHPESEHPQWARLGYKQCKCCPLKESDCAYCPAAARINEVMEVFADSQSIERVKVTVTAGERYYFEDCDLQVGINSLLGLMMATSGCPVLKELGSMASFHIPFCTTRETLHRTVGSYLVKQYFKHRRGEEADWEFKQLKELYGVLEGLNQDFSKRIQSFATSDAVSNAIIMFFATSVVVASSLEEQLAHYESYLTNSPSVS